MVGEPVEDASHLHGDAGFGDLPEKDDGAVRVGEDGVARVLSDFTSIDIEGRHHIDIIKKAYANPLKKRILIFEDDARFNMPFNFKKIKKVLNWLEKNDQCEILYFGSLAFLSYPVNSYILKTHKPYLIHCYCLNRSGMKKILDTVDCEKGCVMDVQFSNIPGLEKYSVYPSINNQESPGDYSKSKLSKYIKFNRVTFFVDNSFYIYIVIFSIIILMLPSSFLITAFSGRIVALVSSTRISSK